MIKSTTELRRAAERLGGRLADGLRRALRVEAEGVMTASLRIVPVDTGALRSTGFVAPAEVSGTKVSVRLGYGGVAGTSAPIAPGVSPRTGRVASYPVGYAVAVHERQAAHNPPQQWKYLEQPLADRRRGMARRIADELRGFARGAPR